MAKDNELSDAKNAKRQLLNIRPREVSLVDEAANLREFITIKRKGGRAMGKKNNEILKGEGDSTAVQRVSAEQQVAALEATASAIERLMAVVNAIKTLEIGEAGPMPEPLSLELKAIASSISGIGLAEPDGEPEGGDGTSEPENQNKGDDPLDFLAKATENVSKAGRKMSAGRLKKFSEAITKLQELLKDLQAAAKEDPVSNASDTKEGKVSKEEAKTAEEVAKQKADEEKAAAEAAEVAKKKEEEEKEAAEVAKKKEEEEAAEVAKKKEEEEAAAKTTDEPKDLTAVLKGIEGLQSTVNDLKESQNKIDAKVQELEKTATPPSAEDPNETEGEVNKNKTESVWGGLFK